MVLASIAAATLCFSHYSYRAPTLLRYTLAAHTDRLTRYQLPAYSPDFNPIEYLWRNVKKDATHLKYFANLAELQQKVDNTLQQLATLPQAILALMGVFVKRKGNHLIVEKGTTSDLGPAP